MKKVILVLVTIFLLSSCSPVKGPDDHLMVYSVTSTTLESGGGVKVLIKASQGVSTMELRYDEVPSWAISGKKIDIVLVE